MDKKLVFKRENGSLIFDYWVNPQSSMLLHIIQEDLTDNIINPHTIVLDRSEIIQLHGFLQDLMRDNYYDR